MTRVVQRVRPAAVAGSFYPAEPGELRTQVAEFLERAPRNLPGGRLRALVVPHAGYVYSGPIAASAYALLARTSPRPTRVVLLGPAHHVALRGLALPQATALETPLGEVPVDAEGARAARSCAQVIDSALAHADEHSLEVQLPFLQCVLPSFSVVPLAVGHCEPTAVAQVIDALGTAETLVVVSSDLSHYLPYAEANAADADTARRVLALDEPHVHSSSACGATPLRGLLLWAQQQGLHVHQLDLRNSGDTAGDRQRVVGYGAFALLAPEGRS